MEAFSEGNTVIAEQHACLKGEVTLEEEFSCLKPVDQLKLYKTYLLATIETHVMKFLL